MNTKFCERCGAAFSKPTKYSVGTWAQIKYCSKRCMGLARVRSAGDRFFEKFIPEPMSGCWLWIGAQNKRGYGTFWPDQKSMQAHRYSYFLYKGEVAENIVIRHTCDIPCCVNPDHLIAGTQKDNINDAKQRGRMANGENHHHSKLTKKIVDFGRKNKLGPTEFAQTYGVSIGTAWSALNGRTWK